MLRALHWLECSSSLNVGYYLNILVRSLAIAFKDISLNAAISLFQLGSGSISSQRANIASQHPDTLCFSSIFIIPSLLLLLSPISISPKSRHLLGPAAHSGSLTYLFRYLTSGRSITIGSNTIIQIHN